MVINLIVWIALGLVAGLLAKFIMPGKDPGGFFVTTLIGVAGAFIGGWIGRAAGFAAPTGGLSVPSIVTAVIGALILLAGYRLLKSR